MIQITLNRYRRRQTNLAGGPCRSDPTSPPPASILAKGAWNASLATHEAVDTRRYRTPHTASHRCRCLTIRSHARVDGHQLTGRHRGDRRRDIRRPHRGSCDAPTFSMTRPRDAARAACRSMSTDDGDRKADVDRNPSTSQES
ncbi:hypothetical protein OPAG_03869 [Rhodococcus opacus PD630]|nr:hypothetical protein OPAG_03869 [Rhodococcus opacus PD630]